MPIYAYRCSSCGYANDHLQKLSDPALSVCPQCAQETYRKQVTAAGFQLKGSGWYVTDFKGDRKKPAPATDKPEKSGDAGQAAAGKEAAAGKSEAPAAGGKADAPGAPAQAESKAAAGGSGADACAVR